ncbi:hypothetical protein [Staphylococcus sp. 17KM0847]|uniref:hypothetical protein n=1 Tax=Staphylococcus sp. 17KM0847 TaxID=2583989 RepID=UPI0015DC80F7|nr:hypothetical protein [Staphylococcus sp. 17KM0847]QLK85489.1 hypothetical protein FGL66_01605 [Staphylococcus sp. 17KM0847]
MALFVILNIIVVITVLSVDLYRHQYAAIRFSSVLLTLTINGWINLILLSKLSFISIFTLLMYCIWTGLQYYLDHYFYHFEVRQQKFLIIILTIMLSIALVVCFQTSDQSYYMSVPYLGPAAFALGAILLFSSTFQSVRYQRSLQRFKIKNPLWIGTLLIILALILMVVLTPFWYLFLLLYGAFITILYFEKLFILK